MFKIESYVTPILLSYVDKYVRDFKPADAQVSLWGGGVALHNLVLKADVLQQELALPFTLVSGRIHELLIQVPWTKIMSEPIVVTIDTIECVLSLNPPPAPPEETPQPDSSSRRAQIVETPPGYMQALVRRIVSNISLRVHHLIVKYVQDDIVMSLNVKHLAVDSTGSDWLPAFADIEQHLPVIRRLVRLDDLTLCLDRSDADGKIRFYQEPLLYRCQLELRVLTKLVSANTRRASSLSIQLRSSKLAWSVTSDQLVLLLRLIKELGTQEPKVPSPSPNLTTANQVPLHASSSNIAESARSGTWSEWAWSWMPTWVDRGEAEESLSFTGSTPISLSVYFDEVSLVFKVMESDGNNRKRSRGVLEMIALHAAVKSYFSFPTTVQLKFGVRTLTMRSLGKCVCGHRDFNAIQGEPTIYLRKIETTEAEQQWNWPEEDIAEEVMKIVETAQDDDDLNEHDMDAPESPESEQFDFDEPEPPQLEGNTYHDHSEFWRTLAPVLSFEYIHERSPPMHSVDPYDNPPIDFQHSDWVENCSLKIKIESMELNICMGLIHRFAALLDILKELPYSPSQELPMRVLTVEECEALYDNLPQRRMIAVTRSLHIRIIPWDHSLTEKPVPPPLILDIYIPKTVILINMPLYPHRVCSAACQLPDDAGPVWQGARFHLTVLVLDAQAGVCSLNEPQPRLCARADLRFVVRRLLNDYLFVKRESVINNYTLKIREINLFGSAARLQAAWEIMMSLIKNRESLPLRHTVLAKEAINDEDEVAIDLSFEEIEFQSFLTKNVNTYSFTMHSARGTVHHEPKGENMKQAWIFSAPDISSTSPYINITIQWCWVPMPIAPDYVGVWVQATAFSVDPLFVAWLAYTPKINEVDSENQPGTSRSVSSTQIFTRLHGTPSSSSRGVVWSGSGTELIHRRTRSAGSSSEPSEKKEKTISQPGTSQTNIRSPVQDWWDGEKVKQLYERLRNTLLTVDLGIVLVYYTNTSASAIDSATLRDAMERHATTSQRVLAISLGRLVLNSSPIMKPVWTEVRNDGPTFTAPRPKQHPEEPDAFPWKMRISDISCYTLEVRAGSTRREKPANTFHSQLKVPCVVSPRTILELVTTTVTIAMITKLLNVRPAPRVEVKTPDETKEQTRLRYFAGGIEFKPNTMKDFLRGPARGKKSPDGEHTEQVETLQAPFYINTSVMSIGMNIYVDTPPIIIKLDHDQVHLVAAAVHCFKHIASLLRRPPLAVSKSKSSTGSPHKSMARSVSEMEEIHDISDNTSTSDIRSELISIYEAHSAQEALLKVKTFFWFQWVVGRVSLMVSSHKARVTFEVDDIITTVDSHRHYSQIKSKVASAFIKHFEKRGNEDWIASVLGGRVLEVREPTNAQEENNFLTITITQAQISKLPTSWKHELHPKLLEKKTDADIMWEIYVTLAPLEMVLRPTVVEHFLSFVREMSPRSICPLQETRVQTRPKMAQWPFLFLEAGGVRLLLTCQKEDRNRDDTIIFEIGHISGNPYPENPICRTPVLSPLHPHWTGNINQLEGRQYALAIVHLAVRTAQFRQIVFQETSEAEIRKGTAGENPALKWSLPDISPVITPVLHPLDIICVLAPTVYVVDTVLCGPAVEINFTSDCLIELSLDQLILVRRFTDDMTDTFSSSSGSSIIIDKEKQGVCPYATLLMDDDSNKPTITISDNQYTAETLKPHPDITSSTDDTATESSTFSTLKSNNTQDDSPLPLTSNSAKKSVSIAIADRTSQDPVDYLEVFVTLGVVDVSLYTVDDNSMEVIALRPPKEQLITCTQPIIEISVEEDIEPRRLDDMETHASNRSISESTRKADMGKAKLELTQIPQARQHESNLPLIHVTINQPHFYYHRKKHERTIQMSIFNLLVGIGLRQVEGFWYSSLLTTAKGAPDPETDIPPALFTVKVVLPPGSAKGGAININSKGNISFEVDRPVLFEVSEDKLRRLKGIYELIEKRVIRRVSNYTELRTVTNPWIYTMRRNLENYRFESMTLQTGQIGLCGSEGTIGWDGVTLQVAIGSRPDRLVIFGSMVALVMSAGLPGDRRHVLLQPLMLGCSVDATWEAWRRVEGGLSTHEPSLLVGIEIDSITLDPRPEDLAAVKRIQNTLLNIFGSEPPACPANSVESLYRENITYTRHTSLNIGDRQSETSNDAVNGDSDDQYYKDDLRSGAFKIIGGDQLPVAYQVTLYENCVTWKYPHPRTITRIVLFPVPDQNEETECVLEFYDPILCTWEPHTYFNLPVAESREAQLYIAPPDAVFALMWRFRACYEAELAEPPFEFDIAKFLPRDEPLMIYPAPGPPEGPKGSYCVTAEQLAGILRVDSYFAPKLLPRVRLDMQLAVFEVNIHNSLPTLSSQSTALEGYYVSRPLMRSHRVLSITARDNTVRAQMGSPAGALVLLDTRISSDILDCTTGAMELFVDKVRTHVALSFPENMLKKARSRVCMRKIRVAIHVPRLRTLHSLTTDWITTIDQYLRETISVDNAEIVLKKNISKREVAAVTATDLEGRISLWIHNSTASALRVGQEGTDEVVPLASGARIAYRWQNPAANRKLRFAIAGPITDWQWSRSIPFVIGSARVRLEDAENQDSDRPVPGTGVFIHTKVTDTGSQRNLHLSGRLVLSNMLHLDLLYKVRARCADSDVWQTITTGQLPAETVGRSVLCGADSHLILKLKFMVCDTGWSGDIPLRECPKENVPWLVKVPLSGEIPYSSMWCRVTRAHADGRLLATMWPMYIIQSHLPLDINVLIHTEAGLSYLDLTDPDVIADPKPQMTYGRGATTHIKVPGTTAARHSMTFQYNCANSSVTCEPVPLHYSVTDTTVFERQTPVDDVDDILDEILEWLQKYGRNAKIPWPYSIVTSHYYGTWLSSAQQPKADIVVRYQPVRGGGGCCLDVQIAPVLLVCNATPIALTLRTHDAAPLCNLEPGVVIAPPSGLIRNPFYVSVELGRDIFVSGPLEVLDQEPSPYFKPPHGQIVIDRPTEFAIQCNQKVVLLNLYYEIKHEINVLGLSVTYMLMNRLNINILISPIVVPIDKENNCVLRLTSYKVAEPTKDGSLDGTPLSRFWIRDRCRSTNPSELRAYLCLALPAGNYPAWTPVPIRLGIGPVRRSVALIDNNKKSVPVVVTQIKHEGRWLVSVGKDPCPQYIVHNRTRDAFAIAEPLYLPDEPSTSSVKAKQECDGTRWWCFVHPNMAVHYSSPSYCARYPATQNTANKPYVPYVIIAKAKEEGDMDWCQPVTVSDGEQLVQLRGGITIKMRIRMHPHSTHIELQKVDHNDISASDIRRRLKGVFSNFTSKSSGEDMEDICNPERTIADSQMVDHTSLNIDPRRIRSPEASEITLVPSFPPVIPPGQIQFPPPPEIPGPSHYYPYATTSNDPYAYDKNSTITRESPSRMLLHDEHTSKQANPEERDDMKRDNQNNEAPSPDQSDVFSSEVFNQEWDDDSTVPVQSDRLRFTLTGASIEMSSAIDIVPLLAVHMDRVAAAVYSDPKKTKAVASVAHIQVDNMQHNTGMYDFAVLANTGSTPATRDRWPSIWTMFQESKIYAIKQAQARLLLSVQYDKWSILNKKYRELTEVSLHAGPISLYIEDAYVKALTELYKMAFPQSIASNEELALAEEWSLMNPLRLRSLHIDPLNLTLTLHTAVRMYIALDQSPLRLSAFKVQDMITTPESLTHMLTVHYLSAAILGAGWVVGGLELLGAPGALAARVSNASGGIRGIASATAAALVRSVSCWAGSLARNLDLLAGDEEHARRAAAARRRPPESFSAGLMTGITNFAINILGAVGGLAHHPFVGVAVGESGSSATALRRGLIGALTKPLSATADLVAFAGHGLLKQTGWDNDPECRLTRWSRESRTSCGWRRDSVRWAFRLAELTPIVGFEVLLDSTPLNLLVTHKYLIIADPDTERIIETIDLRHCKLAPYQRPIIQLIVMQKRPSKIYDTIIINEDEEYQVSASAMARVAHYTGSAKTASISPEYRLLSLLPPPGRSFTLQAALAAALHHTADSHFPLL